MLAWSWLLSAVGLTSAWLLARRSRAGWAVAIACNLLWSAYAILTAQWGFLAAEAAFIMINVRGWINWARPEGDQPRQWIRSNEYGTRRQKQATLAAPFLFAGLVAVMWTGGWIR